MSDKSGKTGLSSGSSWSLFAENTAFEESDFVVERLGNSAASTRLHSEDINKFGSCPSRDSVKLAICKECNKLLIVSAINRHYECKHPKLLSAIKPLPPKRCIPATHHPPSANNKTLTSPTSSYPRSKIIKTGSGGKNFIRIEEMDPHEANVKIEEVPLTIPQFETGKGKVKISKLNLKKLVNEKHSSSGGGSGVGGEKLHSPTCVSPQVSIQVKGVTKKIPQMKEKEFDPDKHCGVWIPEMGKNCTRSLTCKTHPLSMRRQVPGRSKEFDALRAEHRARLALKYQDNASNASLSPQSKGGTPAHSPYGFEKIVFPTVLGPTSNNCKDIQSPKASKSDENVYSSGQPSYVDYITDETFNSSNLSYKQYHPRPIKVNNFGGRQTECHCRLFSRRMDHFKNAFGSMLNSYNSNSTSKHTKNSKETFTGTKPAVQDPLQNGIIHKQKNGSRNIRLGVKRQYSTNDVDGGSHVVDTSKRRASSDINIVDPFTNNVNQQQQPQKQNLLKAFSTVTTTKNNVKKVATGAPASATTPSVAVEETVDMTLIDEFLSTNLNADSPSSNTVDLTRGDQDLSNSLSTTNFVATDDSQGRIVVGAQPITNKSQPTVVTVNALNALNALNSANTLLDGSNASSLLTSAVNKSVTPAPNITITQGMIVSLPNATGLRNSFTITPQSIGKLRTDQTTTSANMTIKQVLSKDRDLRLSIPNGSNAQGNASYSIDALEPAPNITVTSTTLSLSGVLQGQTSQSPGITKTTLKRINTNQYDRTRILQHLIVQQQQQQQQQQQRELQTTESNFATTGLQQQQQQTTQTTVAINNLSSQRTLQQQQQQQQPNIQIASVTSPANQQLKAIQRMQLQQINPQQLQQQNQQQGQQQSTQLVAMQQHTGFTQQILPKLSSAPQNITTFNTGQFSSNSVQNSLQFITQANNSTAIQQQSSTLS